MGSATLASCSQADESGVEAGETVAVVEIVEAEPVATAEASRSLSEYPRSGEG